MAKKVTTYQEDLIEALKDPVEASAYLNVAMEEDDRTVFLLALRNVADAHGGMSAIAKKTRLNRESLYKMLSERGNPEIKNVLNLLASMGLKLTVVPRSKPSKAQKIKKAA